MYYCIVIVLLNVSNESCMKSLHADILTLWEPHVVIENSFEEKES